MFRFSLFIVFVSTFAHPTFGEMVSLSDANLFNGTTAVASSTFGHSAFSASNLVYGTNRSFVFADSRPTATISISGFNSPIDTIRFFDTPSYDGRVATFVSIYTSTSLTSSLSTGSYSFHGSYDLVTRNISHSSYHDGFTNATSPAEFPFAGDPAVFTNRVINYEEIDGLGIGEGTRSILFSFTEVHPSFGSGLTEIQAFGSFAAP